MARRVKSVLPVRVAPLSPRRSGPTSTWTKVGIVHGPCPCRSSDGCCARRTVSQIAGAAKVQSSKEVEGMQDNCRLKCLRLRHATPSDCTSYVDIAATELVLSPN